MQIGILGNINKGKPINEQEHSYIMPFHAVNTTFSNGLQIGFLNTANINGIQIGFFNRTVDGSLFYSHNYNDGLVRGIQIGSLNLIDDLSGIQIALVNFSTYVTGGIQIGMINYSEEMAGVQIRLIMNNTIKLSGIQIGLINCIDGKIKSIIFNCRF